MSKEDLNRKSARYRDRQHLFNSINVFLSDKCKSFSHLYERARHAREHVSFEDELQSVEMVMVTKNGELKEKQAWELLENIKDVCTEYQDALEYNPSEEKKSVSKTQDTLRIDD